MKEGFGHRRAGVAEDAVIHGEGLVHLTVEGTAPGEVAFQRSVLWNEGTKHLVAEARPHHLRRVLDLVVQHVQGFLLERESGAWLWWVIPPGLLITLTVLGFAFFGFALEELFDPKLRRRGKVS